MLRVRKNLQGAEVAVASPKVRMPKRTGIQLSVLQLQGETQIKRGQARCLRPWRLDRQPQFLLTYKRCTARHFCPRCGKSYTLVKNLKRHLSVECQKEKRFKCRFCSNSYYYRTDLRNHLHRVHDVIVRFDAGAVYL